MCIRDSSTAVPSIVADLGDFPLFPWLFSVYLLAQAVTVPVYAKLADTVGRKPIILIGIGLFLLGSIPVCSLADRLPRRLILGVTQSLQMLFAFGFFAVYQAGWLTPWRVILLLSVNGIVSGIQRASWQAFGPTLVPREHLVTAS